MLEGHAQAAGGSEDTDRSRHPEPSGKRSVEVEDKGVAHILFHPLVEDLDQETAELLGLHRPVRDLAAFLVAGFVVTLDNGDELDVMCPELVPEKPVDVQRMIGVFRVDRAEDVEFHLVFLEQSGSRQDPIEGPMASLVFAVDVVKLLGAIEAQADQKVVLVKELAPLVVEKDAVRLEGVLDACAGLLRTFSGAPPSA